MGRVILKNLDFGFLKKYKYVIAILVVGIFLMCLPQGNSSVSTQAPTLAVSEPAVDTQSALEEILSQVAGAGKVKVLLTIGEGERVLYQVDESTTTAQENNTRKTETVITTDSDRAQNGLIQQINPPVYLGAVVVCQGADSAAVRLAITEAVQAATGLRADQITVLKMK